MEEAWYTGVADELARCLTDARYCAAACETLLARTAGGGDGIPRERAFRILVAPAAIARVLIDLIDHPREIVLAAASLCRDSAADAARELRPDAEAAETVAALDACARSCGALVDAL